MTDGKRRLRLFASLVGLVFFLCVTLAALVYGATRKSTLQPDTLISTVIGLIGLIIAVLQLLSALTSPAAGVAEEERLDAAASALARQVRQQWDKEADVRALHQPAPLQVRWRTTTRRVAARPEYIVGAVVGGNPLRLKFHGRLNENAQKFLKLPNRQLVVLGAPGSGKTVFALLLTLGLLDVRRSADPVPVLLPALSFDPTRESFAAWVGRRVAEDYPHIRDLAGPETAARLYGSDRILPIVDGLDEIAEPLRPAAIRAIGTAVKGRPIVVTCRTREYAGAVGVAGTLPTAAVIELEPVSVNEAIGFLQADSVLDGNRWDRVAALIRADPHGEHAQALSTPLMVGLARSIYRNSAADPGELLDAQRFPTRAAIEAYLLDRYVNAVYGAPRLDDVAATPWEPKRAQTWLKFLARHLHTQRTRDLEWWHLYRALPPRAARLAFVLIVGLTGVIVSTVLFGLTVGGHAATVAGVSIGAACAGTAALAAWFGAVPGKPVQFAVMIGRGGDLRDMIRSTVVGGLAPGLVFTVAASFTINPLVGIGGGIVAGLLAGLLVGLVRWSVPAENANAADPHSVLTQDRRAALVQGLAAVTLAASTIWIVMGQRYGIFTTIVVAIVGGSFLGCGFMLGTAWAWFQGVRVWLALRGHIPWRLMDFLDDGHKRGVFRRAGAVYQFRHGRLQDRLAETHEESCATVPGRGTA